ncbi:GLUG domain-containing protein [Halovivax asiaticus JCM 14624]|uniref:GLUG domain-containing protein n=2 Tax=Halovivax asiaticus TaxID=332953 RepID=M0BJR1_9EURY|nr:GLUG domain-containing protein [Halovivax asiaticus JCM 14624]
MQLDLGAHYVLVDDVDASDTADWNDGRGFDPVGATTKFSGTFDGDGHVVDGLVIDRPDSEHVGLFGVLSGSLSNARVRDATVTGDRGVGTLVGYLTGSVDESAASGTVSGTDDAGGLVGQTQSGAAITDSHAATTVTGESTVGGLVGSLVDLATVEGSFATGEVSGDIGGGLVGSAGGWATVTDAYWNVGTTGQPTSGGDAVGLTTDEMTGANATEFMDGLALESTWIALDGEYPALSGEVTSYDLSLASDEIAVDGGSTDATVIVGLRDGTTATATTTSTYATGGNVSVDGDGTATADAYGPDTVTAAAGGYSDAVAVIALDADYEITFTDVPATAAAGGSYWINATVRNVGNDQGADNVSLAFDGATIFDQSTTVGAGATESIAFEYTVPEDTATGSVALDATTPHDDATRSVHVNGYETLSGTITDGVTGKALSNRNVTVADGAGTRTVTTNASGAYSIEVHNASTAIVSASSRTSWGNGSVAIANSSTTTIRNATTLDLALFQTLPGSGTASDPFRIDTAAELQTISQDLAANYTLVGDIDASGTAVWNDGAGFDPLGGSSTTEFSGTFDGDGHEIEGLTIDRPGSDYVGLFGEAVGIVDDVAIANASVVGNDDVAGLVGFGHEDAEVRNATVSGSVRGTTRVGGIAGQADLPLTNVSVTADVNGTDVVGGLAGIVGSDRIDRSWASGTVTGTDAKIGGLVGNVRNAEITDSWASGDVVVDGDAFDVGGLVGYVDVGSGISNVSATGDVVAPGGDEVGGLVGHHNARIVSNAWASGNVTGNESVGGLFGYAFHSSDSYATGAVTGNASLGGAIGTNSSYATISSVYWDVNATGKNSSAGNATGLTTAQLTGATVNGSLAGFDFERAWTATDGYPRLQTEVESVDLSVDDAALRPGETADATVAIDLVSGDTATATTVANYTSTAPGVATVDGGEIVARGAGSATITATVAGLNASADVRVAARLSTDDGDDDNQPARELNVSVVDLAPEDANFTVGKPVTIDVMVVNDGVATAEYAVVLSLNGTAVATESGTVEAGSTTAVELSHAFDEPGTYTLSVADRSFDVTVESERSGPSDDGDSTDSFGSAGSDDFAGDSRSSGDASPGFGVLGAVVALLAVAAATRRR